MKVRSRYLAGGIVAGVLSVLAWNAPAMASAGPPVIHPRVIAQICNNKGNGDCLQAAGSGATVHAFAFNGQPNQQFNLFVPSNTVCGDNISDTNCPFPGAPVGKQIAVIGGQSAQNAGLCGGWTQLGFSGSLVPCNGGSGTVFVIDGFALESGLIGRKRSWPARTRPSSSSRRT